MNASSQRTRLHRSEVGLKVFDQGPAVGHGKPYAQKMPSFIRFNEILECGSSMESGPVVQEKHIPGP